MRCQCLKLWQYGSTPPDMAEQELRDIVSLDVRGRPFGDANGYMIGQAGHFKAGELRIGMFENKWTHNYRRCGHEHHHGLGASITAALFLEFSIRKHSAHREIYVKFLAT